MSGYSLTIDKFNEHAPQDNRRACILCSASTLLPMFTQYSGRCLSCFDAYCAIGIRGGQKGFSGGASDTATQANMRKGVKQ